MRPPEGEDGSNPFLTIASAGAPARLAASDRVSVRQHGQAGAKRNRSLLSTRSRAMAVLRARLVRPVAITCTYVSRTT